MSMSLLRNPNPLHDEPNRLRWAAERETFQCVTTCNKICPFWLENWITQISLTIHVSRFTKLLKKNAGNEKDNGVIRSGNA